MGSPWATAKVPCVVEHKIYKESAPGCKTPGVTIKPCELRAARPTTSPSLSGGIVPVRVTGIGKMPSSVVNRTPVAAQRSILAGCWRGLGSSVWSDKMPEGLRGPGSLGPTPRFLIPEWEVVALQCL